MEYSSSQPCAAGGDWAFDLATAVLVGAGFRLQARDAAAIRFTGPGLTHNVQNPLRGAASVRLEKTGEQLTLTADLGGIAKMQAFLRKLIFGLALLLAVLFGPVMGLVLGKVFGLGFGAPVAPGIAWLGFAVPLALAPFVPWLFILPWIERQQINRTRAALDDLVASLANSG